MSVFSHSRLACFENCPLKFRFRYLDKVKAPRGQGIEAFMGSMVHAALEKLYKDLRFRKLNTLEELLGWFRAQWKKNWNDDIVIVRKQYGPGNYLRMGEDYISDYYKRYQPFNQERTIALEEKVNIMLDSGGRYRLRGYIDRLSYAGKGVYKVHDYKTNFNIPVKKYIEDDRQLALYALAVLDNYHDAKRVKLVWHFLSADKEVVIEKSQEELDALKMDTIGLIDRIRAESEFPPRPGKLCEWCEFRPECPAQKHLVKVEGLPPNRYLREPGVRLVNRYAELRKKQKEFNEDIETELRDVQEAIFRYAEKEGVRVVAGSDVRANLWSKDCIRFPGKKDPGRKELEELIRASGQWESASMLDTWELERLVSSGALPQDLIRKLARFARKENLRRIYLKKAES
jgi:putative RecB family exonuclease